MTPTCRCGAPIDNAPDGDIAEANGWLCRKCCEVQPVPLKIRKSIESKRKQSVPKAHRNEYTVVSKILKGEDPIDDIYRDKRSARRLG
jgi:hypothetical protein